MTHLLLLLPISITFITIEIVLTTVNLFALSNKSYNNWLIFSLSPLTKIFGHRFNFLLSVDGTDDLKLNFNCSFAMPL
jgi:hypothetical protein